ncbi:hypothetical protein [Solidesulfovibrio carbinolicus]|uniref:hypothetical protein n=1 Tax=Solidesulfovibrio carbinolicus TaxID=296842 RepID=UPI001010657F|nr:hypothetical protein [Solidesulfovibrio carbinolicus]
MKIKISTVVFVLSLLATGTVFFFAQEGLITRTICSFIVPWQDTALRRERFLECSNIQQQIIFTDNIATSEEQNTPWQVLSPRDPSKPALVKVTLKVDRDLAILYPRTSGPEDAITIHEERNVRRRLLFVVNGKDRGWSPISKQYRICLDCVDFGWVDEDFNTTLVISLYGKFAQLWTLNGAVFF